MCSSSFGTIMSNITDDIMNDSKNNTYDKLIGTNSSQVISEPTTDAYCLLKLIYISMTTYITPVITILGTIGNILSMLVFMRTRLKKLTSSYYLAFLALFDTGFLWCIFIEWLNILHIDIYKRNGLCQLFTWLSAGCSVLSAWLVVAFTIERFVAVIKPFLYFSKYTVDRAQHIILILVLLTALFCSPLLVIVVSVKAQKSGSGASTSCGVHQKYLVSGI